MKESIQRVLTSGPTRRLALLCVAAPLLVLAGVAVSEAQRLRSNVDREVRPTEVREEMEKVDAKLRAGKWKPGLKEARVLTKVVVQRTWYGRELGPMLAELALYQALAEANLGRRDEAIWHWHMAQNLDFRVRRRDLSPYGEAGKLLLEFPLRDLGEVPVPYVVPSTYPGGPRLVPAFKPEMPESPTILNNTGAALEGTGDLDVEVIFDETGQLRQPVVISSHLHPIVIYATLEWLRGIPPFNPSLYKGEPADDLGKIKIQFKVSRW